MHSDYYIGIMSGTSCDGIDTVLTRITPNSIDLMGTHFSPFSNQLKQDVLQLCTPGPSASAVSDADKRYHRCLTRLISGLSPHAQ